jgi:predicted  nucleic acid-binding Zn-ribbon protein
MLIISLIFMISRGTEMPQRQSPRGPHPLRTSSSDSDPLHHRPTTERSPKLADRRSPRSAQTDSLGQKKLGTRIADLESQLGQAQQELKILKDQLVSAEAAKKEAQEELEKKSKKPVVPEPVELQGEDPPTEIQESKKSKKLVDPEPVEIQGKEPPTEIQASKKSKKLVVPEPVEIQGKEPPTEIQESKKSKNPVVPEPVEIQGRDPPTEIQESDCNKNDTSAPDEKQNETDVFEVLVEKVTVVEPRIEHTHLTDQVEKETKPIDVSTEPPANPELEKPSFHDSALTNDEIHILKAKLEEKEKELDMFIQENENLRNQLIEAALKISSAQSKEEETALRLSQLGEELKTSDANAAQLSEKMKAVEEAKEALEAEMKKLRVQTEQWRKAADAAAAVLAGDMEMNGRIYERCVSMDKQFGGVFEPPAGGGYTTFGGSPRMAYDLEDGPGSGKRKGSGIRKLGHLWGKKGQK